MSFITEEEYAIYEEISRLAHSLWQLSLEVVGLNNDPKMFSVMLFKRLWSNHRGYTLLHNNSLSLEADIILRSGIEAAICIAANYQLREEFVTLLRKDTAHTVKGQIKIHRTNGDNELVKEAEELLRSLQSKFQQGEKAARLNWKELALAGKVPDLYNHYKNLSGLSSHVTGMSILKASVSFNVSDLEEQRFLDGITKKMNLMMMAGATLQGAMLHSAMIDSQELSVTAIALLDKLNLISENWEQL